MTEYWVEENIRPASNTDLDRLLIDDIEPIVNALKTSGIISWHYLREDEGWKVTQTVRHVRLRRRLSNLQQLKSARLFLKRRLDHYSKLD